MDLFEERSSSYLSHKREFSDFLESDALDYTGRIRRMISAKQSRLLVNINDVQRFNPELHRRLLTLPTHYYAPFTATLKEAVRLHASPDDIITANKHEIEYSIGFEGHFGEKRMTPRQLHAHHLGQLVCIEGIATKCSIVRPKVVRTVHHNGKLDVYTSVSYHDATSLTGYPTSSVYPTKDRDGNPLTTEFGLSHYADHQTLSIQEMPEKAPAGLLPSSIDVVLDDDLVDKCKPGDRVCIVGIYRALPTKTGAEGSGVFRSVLIANNVRPMQQGGSIGDIELTHADTTSIRAVSRRSDLFSLLSRSIAPSIFGHSTIKEALLLLLLGGVEKNLANGTHIRGDINLLMVGDPSTAKSQLLRFILHIAPLAINTTGRGSSGVGLTAAVTSDRETGDRRLEAGAMVLADRGVVCIDEFDKMSDADRVAIHEVMEQQTVTIAKAGIHMSLNARCSVVAAANPRYSQYDKNKTPAFNVNLPDSLLSRFDLLFIVLDTPDAAMDRRVAERVLSNHRYKDKKGVELFTTDGGDDEEDVHDTQRQSIYQKFDPLLYTAATSAIGTAQRSSKKEQVLSMTFLKKYIQYAKRMEPVLTEESAALVGTSYAELRTEQAQKANGYPITARCLETLIRLSTAHAKARLSEEVDEDDVKDALRIIKSAIEGSKDGREEEKEKRQAERDERKRREGGGAGGANDDDGGDDEQGDGGDDERKVGGGRLRRGRASQEDGEHKEQPQQDDVNDDGAALSDDEAERKYDDEQEQEDDGGTTLPATRRRRRSEHVDASSPAPTKRRTSSRSGRPAAPADSLDTTQTMEMDIDEPIAAGGVEELTNVRSARGLQFTRLLAQQFATQNELQLSVAVAAINSQLRGERPYSRAEAQGLLEQLEQQDKIMVRGGVIHRV